ncbi:MAG: ThiF family adenylyltransferase [Deltaproteobacteria bacterium]|nr:ThiF family adenylyltransferase [Deltaproteobacteria bacterium]
MNNREQYFARIEPLLGQGLSQHTLDLQGVRACARAAEMLAGCRLQRFRCKSKIWLQKQLKWKNGFRPARVLGPGPADARLVGMWIPANEPAALDFHFEQGLPCVTLRIPKNDRFALAQLNTQAARWILDGLLKQSWPTEGRSFFGQRAWPYSQTKTPGPICPPTPTVAGQKHIMVIGLGSLGSEAIRLLRRKDLRWTLVDPAEVSLHNPIRQWYGTEEIGQSKVACLARRLRSTRVRSVPEKLEDDGIKLRALIKADRPDLVLLSAGTAEHANLADVLWEESLPHISVLAYPRARFFEITAVVPKENTPCLDCYRGRLYSGPQASLPIDEELSSFLYERVAPEDRERIGRELVAEPATPIDTNRIAEVAARIAAELLSAPLKRSFWMQRLLNQNTTCLLGGNTIEQKENGNYAYGLSQAGQVIRLGLEDIAGYEEVTRCNTCGRSLQIHHHIETPPSAESIFDPEQLTQALLGSDTGT